MTGLTETVDYSRQIYISLEWFGRSPIVPKSSSILLIIHLYCFIVIFSISRYVLLHIYIYIYTYLCLYFLFRKQRVYCITCVSSHCQVNTTVYTPTHHLNMFLQCVMSILGMAKSIRKVRISVLSYCKPATNC